MNDHFVSVFGEEAVALDEDGRLLRRRLPVGPRVADVAAAAALAVGAGAAFVAAVPAPRVLDEAGAVLLPLAPQRRRDRVVAGPVGGYRHFGHLDRLFDRVALASEKVSRQGVEDVGAVHQVAAADGDVHGDDLVLVGLVDLQRRFQNVQEVGQLVVADVLGAVRIELLPDLVVHVVVVVGETFLHVLGGLRVVLQDDGDVHVDDDQEADDQVGEQEGDAHGGVAAVARRARLRVRLVALLLVDDAFQDAVPSGRRRHLEEQDHGLAERLEVVDLVDARLVLDVHEERHAEDGEDEHDQEEQQADVEQRRQGHGQGEQQRPDALGALDQTQDSTHFGHSHHTQQRRRHKVLFDQITQHQTFGGRKQTSYNGRRIGNTTASLLTQNGQDDDHKVEQVPRLLEVIVAQGEHLERALGGEDDDEQRVEDVQHHGQRGARLVLIQRHRHHVQTDEQHDDHVELLVGHDVEDDGLRSPLLPHFFKNYCN